MSFDKEYDAVTALEYVLGAIGADVLNGFLSLARRRRLAIDGAEALVEGQLHNPLTALGVVGEKGNPGLARLSVKVFVSSLESAGQLQAVWEDALHHSPLAHTFKSVLDLEFRIAV